MCGIVGYVGKKKAYTILFNALKRLEYRGYDSYGFCTASQGKLHVQKDVGKISEAGPGELPGTIGIAHTRWATHGSVSRANTHPHTDCREEIAVVHNGIIENFQELRKELVKRGHKFKSDTDTEIIPHLIEENLRSHSFFDSVKLALKRLEGSYAVIAVKKDENRMIAARRGSPLVLGIGKGEYFAASDIPAFLEHTKQVMYLHDGDVVVFDNGLEVFNIIEDRRVERKADTVDWDAEQARKGSFEHFMLKEISEQADVIKKAILQDSIQIKRIAEEINRARGVFLVACGTAAHACFSASYFFSKVARKHINVVLGSEFPYYKHFLTPQTLVIAVSQSGETADTLESVRTAKEAGARVIALVNVMGSTLTRESDEILLLNAGPEIGVASTKAYTAMLVVLYLIAFATIGKFEEGKQKLRNLYLDVYNLTSATMRERISTLAERLKSHNHMFLLGRGLQYPTAQEAALKIKEVSYIHAEAFASGELKHGTIALIEKGTPAVFFIAPDNEKETISNAMEVKSRGGFIIGVGSKNSDVFDFWIKTPEAGDMNPIVQIIPMQVLAYELAVLKGCDPDRPRSLAKSVTVR